MPDHYREFGESLLDFEVRDDDVWVCSFPKTGTTWTQEMVWCIANDLDYEGARVSLDLRFPFVDVPGIFYHSKVDRIKSDLAMLTHEPLTFLEGCDSPRFIKSHLPFELLPLKLQKRQSKAKIVAVTRNPRDTCVSYFHHCKLYEGYTGDFEDFCKLFLNDAVTYAPFDRNVLSYWNRKDTDPSIIFVKYEDMKKDLPSVIKRVSAFLGKEYTDSEIGVLAEHLSFESMKRNPAVVREEILQEVGLTADDSVFREGKIGGWKKAMTAEMVKEFEAWTASRFLSTGLDWEYDP
ncbi:hypothetical protein AAG570_006413 [Ranatra chinensis]|uniref:Sulfotransferase domain-containing protein n=1 Tax=Ranatra chinensis TaxID=642074 RepID=A0ABD0YW31_9HEMI